MYNCTMAKVFSREKYVKRYTEDDITKAVEAVRNGMPKKTASKKFGVPRATIQFRMSAAFVKSRPGPPTTLFDYEESVLVEWLITSARKGFPKRKEDVLASVEQFLKDNPRCNKLVDDKPGDGWYRLFLKRHPEISTRTAEAVTSASANVSEGNVRKWFKQVETYLAENDFMSILEDSKRVYNGDETNFQLCPKNSKVLAPRGAKDVYEVDNAVAKSSLTVMFTFSANGDITPPMIIYPLKRMRADIRTSVPSSWGLGLSDNGWMNKELFHQYIQNILYPHLLKQGVQFPIILFVDGHKSHINYHLSKTCQEYGIILVALYPNATRILQPADVAAFKPIKNAWRKGVLEWRRNNITKNLTKVDFAPILDLVLKNQIKKQTLINGFKVCGLCPWNPDAINYSKCLGKNTESRLLDSQPISISLPQFEHLVGSTIISNLKNSSHTQDCYFKALLKVYQTGEKLNEDNILQKNNHENIDFDLLSANEDWMVLPFEIEDLEKDVSQNNNPVVTPSLKSINVFDLSSPHFTEIDNFQEQISAQNSRPFELQAAFIDNNRSNQNSAGEILHNKVAVSSAVAESEQINSQIDQETPKKDMRNSLTWPKTPVRKGKQVNLEPIYVLTSEDWLKQEKNKLGEKEKKENEKQQRKRQREENKTNKEKQLKKIKKQSSINKIDQKNNVYLSASENCKSIQNCAEEKRNNSKISTEYPITDKENKNNIGKKKGLKAEKSANQKKQYCKILSLPASVNKSETEYFESVEESDIVSRNTLKVQENIPVKLSLKKGLMTPVKFSPKKNIFIPVKLMETKKLLTTVKTTETTPVELAQKNIPKRDSDDKVEKPCIVSNTIFALPKLKLLNLEDDQERNRSQYLHTVKHPQDFLLSKPMEKLCQRRETFKNEKELADFLSEYVNYEIE